MIVLVTAGGRHIISRNELQWSHISISTSRTPCRRIGTILTCFAVSIPLQFDEGYLYECCTLGSDSRDGPSFQPSTCRLYGPMAATFGDRYGRRRVRLDTDA